MTLIRLSPYQNFFYYEWRLSPERYDYNIVLDQEITGSIDIKRLEQAICLVSGSYFIFNSHVVKNENDQLFWQYSDKSTNLNYFSNKLADWQILDYVKQPFNLETGPLCRYALIQLAPQQYRFIMVIHHILMDGLSGDQSFQALANYYNDDTFHEKQTLLQQQQLLANLADQLEHQLEDNETACKEFWQQKLAKVEKLDFLFLKNNNPANINSLNKNPIGEIKFAFDQGVVDQVNLLKRKYQITPYLYSQAIYALLLYKLSGQPEFGVSYPVAIKEGIGLIYGAHINTNIIPFDFEQIETVTDLLMSVKKFVKSLKQGKIHYGYYPIEKIIAASGKQVLGVSFAATNFKQYAFHFKDCETTRIYSEFNIDQIDDLSLLFSIENNKLEFIAKYKIAEVDQVLLEPFIAMYKSLYINILDRLVVDNLSTLPVKSLQLLSAEQYQQIVIDWNKTETNYPDDKTIHQMFEEQAAKTPDNIAVIYEDTQLTYQELNQRSNQLAHYLRTNYQTKGDDLIALCLERNEYMLIAILGILKAGAAYVPIDPGFPIERIKYILEDTKAKVVLTNKIHCCIFPEQSICDILAIDSKKLPAILLTHSAENSEAVTKVTDLAYVIYTSGTTGVPKGVMISHLSYIITLNSLKELYFKQESPNTYSITNYVFDIFGLEYGLPLLNGGIVELGNVNFENLDCVNYNFIQMTPSLCELKLDQLKNTDHLKLLIGGENVNYDLLMRILDKNIDVINVYGPTETTIWSTAKLYSKHEITDKVSIGRPLSNEKVYILDKNLYPLPIGAVGELYIGGAGLARGYLNLPELTNEKFIANPFQSEADKQENRNAKLYKTGDLARWLPDGNIEYIGRNNFQVKIRGFRIELGEIEARLLGYPGIKQAVVLAVNQKATLGDSSENKYLAAYYVADTQLDEDEINTYLAGCLPDYMQPSQLVYLEKLPLNVNGKLDRKALPVPEFTSNREYVAPRNEIEAQICEMYAQVLNIPLEKVGIHDNFFQLGGNSILAIKLTTQLQHNFKISVNEIFTLKTPAKISATVPFIADNLHSKLEQIKLIYANLPKPDSVTVNKQVLYKKESEQILFNQKLKNINNVLLTGSTGFLGCNVLYQLLDQTEYKIYLLVRASSDDEAYQRVKQKFSYYFDTNLDKYQNRLVAMDADLAKPQLNLSDNQYQSLVKNIDSIIHCAALVKHYGNYEEFYQTNVQSTINLLELARLTQLKDFHYVSTKAVFAEGYVPEHNHYTFTEDDSNDILKDKGNLYLLTKYEGEQVAVKYREYGVTTNIYRVGNLVMHSGNYKIQQNIEDNGFYQRVNALLNLKMIPSELAEAEISPVDSTALSIVKLFNQAELNNQVYHVFNPYNSNIAKLLSDSQDVKLNQVELAKFVDTISSYLASGKDTESLELFLLHQGWLQDIDINNQTKIEILSDKTTSILNQLGFNWPKIKSIMLSELIEKLHELKVTN